jgi:hypothetical protein
VPVVPPVWCSLAAHAPQIVSWELSHGAWTYHTLTENVVPDTLSGRLFPTGGVAGRLAVLKSWRVHLAV